MPRRRGTEAQAVAIKENLGRLSLLLRNPDFRKDLVEARRHPEAIWAKFSGPVSEELIKMAMAEQEAQETESQAANPQKEQPPEQPARTVRDYWDLLSKWGLLWFPQDIIRAESLPSTIEQLESAIHDEMKVWIQSPDATAGYVHRPAVIAEDPAQVFIDRYWDGDDPRKLPPRLCVGKLLHLRVDMSYPVDVLCALIEVELRRVYKQNRERENRVRGRQVLPAKPPRRRRLDKLGLQLKVYDLAEQGKTFAETSREVKKPVPTVKSCFLSASRKVHSLSFPDEVGPTVVATTSSETPTVPSKKELPLTNFDPAVHIPNCPTCSAAERVEGLCAQARIFTLQDYVSQGEFPAGPLNVGAKPYDEVEPES